ncbi:hypothetical protein [Streptomyces alboniger]|uniref:Uncharacterized protein n=1 Tax=Streptomyces alboniger TaxID=132473 RepID=A0A5J6HKA9_STRAD|nr:hypothetical protein [Streptomyces alboniger]QEV18800.1 hypothetical protein CP975_16050 [Streptomyces alboniger]
MGDITGRTTGGGSGSGTLHLPPVELPDPAGLSEEQVCGRTCVWCRGVLDNTTAFDLGARKVNAHGSGARWYPRCCRRPCGFQHIHQALLDHTQSCEQCADDLTRCTDGKALRTAMRTVR